jgi:hypothetical protein
MRIRSSCGSGQQCPALDRVQEGFIDVTGYFRETRNNGEAVVRVPDGLLAEIPRPIDYAEFIDAEHRTDLFRVQTRTEYSVASDDGDFRRWVAGELEPQREGMATWLWKIRQDTAAGAFHRNLHVLRRGQPLNGYLRYQFEWCYTYNAAAGMDIRVLEVDLTPLSALLTVGDFAILERRHVVELDYSDDGEWQGARLLGPGTAGAHLALAEFAWDLAVPFGQWWAEHPQYHRRRGGSVTAADSFLDHLRRQMLGDGLLRGGS